MAGSTIDLDTEFKELPQSQATTGGLKVNDMRKIIAKYLVFTSWNFLIAV